MTKFKSSSVKESISNAIHGLKLAVSSHRNIDILDCDYYITVI